MKLISVNVGMPAEIESGGKTIRTSIFKSPVDGSVRVSRLNLDGDQQSDLTVHGGVDKAVIPIHPSITRFGETTILESISGGERWAKTSRQKACSRIRHG